MTWCKTTFSGRMCTQQNWICVSIINATLSGWCRHSTCNGWNAFSDSIVLMLRVAEGTCALSPQQKMLVLYTIITHILLFKVVYSIVFICGGRLTWGTLYDLMWECNGGRVCSTVWLVHAAHALSNQRARTLKQSPRTGITQNTSGMQLDCLLACCRCCVCPSNKLIWLLTVYSCTELLCLCLICKRVFSTKLKTRTSTKCLSC